MSDASHAQVPHHGGSLPRGVIVAAGLLIAFAISLTLFGHVSDIGAQHMPDVKAYKVLELRFEDRDDGAVVVRDADDGAQLYVVEPGVGGFIRATMRGMARERHREDRGAAVPAHPLERRHAVDRRSDHRAAYQSRRVRSDQRRSFRAFVQ